jgi:hypothetical protein
LRITQNVPKSKGQPATKGLGASIYKGKKAITASRIDPSFLTVEDLDSFTPYDHARACARRIVNHWKVDPQGGWQGATIHLRLKHRQKGWLGGVNNLTERVAMRRLAHESDNAGRVGGD